MLPFYIGYRRTPMKKCTFFEMSYKDFSVRFGKGIDYGNNLHLIEYQKDENFLIEFSKDILRTIPQIIKWFFEKL